jgi:Phosphopantetheine attachment site
LGQIPGAALIPAAPRDDNRSMAAVDSIHASLCELVAELMSTASGRAFPRAHVSFLAAGGTEAQASELTNMVNALFGLELPADTVMRSPTPDALARTIESSWRASPSDLAELTRAIADAA